MMMKAGINPNRGPRRKETKMTINEFQALLIAKHPQAEVSRTSEAGAIVKVGLTVTFTPGGQMYHYQGSFYAIAQQLGLIEKWYVLCNGSVVEQAQSEAEALDKMEGKRVEAMKMAADWGNEVGTFTIRKVNWPSD